MKIEKDSNLTQKDEKILVYSDIQSHEIPEEKTLISGTYSHTANSSFSSLKNEELFLDENSNYSSSSKDTKILLFLCISVFACFCFLVYSFKHSESDEKHYIHKISPKPSSSSLSLKNWYEH